MHYIRIANLHRPNFGNRDRAHTVRVRAGRLLVAACLLATLLTHPQRALATVQVSGLTYAYSGNPVTYGLPFFGNDVDYDALFPNPTTFEFNAVAGPAGTSGNNEIVVGKGARGDLLISAASIIRGEDLIIGDIGTAGPLANRPGLGTMRVTGFGSIYNNDPAITAMHPSVIGTGWSTIRSEGNSLIIGRGNGSNGHLDVNAGGNVEIQSGVFIGQDSFSTGLLTVDGLDSSFTSGGYGAVPTNVDNLMIVGQRGTGIMRVTNGGTVVTEAAPQGGGSGQGYNFGATIGALPATTTPPGQPGFEGGQGTVEVTGPASKWFIGGSLQIGGFHNTQGPLGEDDNIGELVEYDTNAGTGTLLIELGGLVSIHPAIAANPDQDDLVLAIGRFGNLNLEGGNLTLGVPGLRTFRDKIINDGTISGGGRIDTGVFYNRYVGQLLVGAGESLTIASLAEFEANSLATVVPFSNYGLIETIGTVDSRAELVFERPFFATDVNQPNQPFFNRPLPAAPVPPGYRGGLISAQHATLRFESGIQNEGIMNFTAGTNILSGRVENVSSDASNGRFIVFPDTTVNVEGDFASGGIVGSAASDLPILSIREGGLLNVLDFDSFTLQGHLDMTMSFSNPAKIQVGGDVGLDGDLYVSFDNDTLGNLAHGDSFELIYFAGFIGGVDDSDPLHIVPDLGSNPVLNVVPDPIFNLLYPNLDLVTFQLLQSYYLFVLDPTQVGTPGGPGAIGPDFNGDGVVDLDDIAIWQANEGINQGASVLQGDADGDGDVDGDDLAFILRNLGQPPPWSGSGSGSESGLATVVPEPTSLMLVLSSGLLVLAGRRSRRFVL